MDLSFGSATLRNLCNRRSALVRRHGTGGAAAIARCLQELEAADSLATAALLPHLTLTPAAADSGRVTVTDPDGMGLVLCGDPPDAWAKDGHTWRSATAAIVVQITNGGAL